MNYILKNIRKDSLMETILSNRKIEDVQRVLNPDNSSDTDTSKITSIEQGINLIKQNLNNGRILILIDSDVDGMTSGAIMYKYLKMINKYSQLSYYFHNGKQHGITEEFMNFLVNNEFDLIIIPDAGTNDLENIEKIKMLYGTDILIIDHHPVIDKISEYAITINNQLCEYTNSNLTGAGLTYLFCKEMNKQYQIDEFDELLDLALVGQVGDCSNLVENEVRNMCFSSLKNIKNKFMTAIYNECGKDITNLSITDLSFGGIIPLINSVMRIGTAENKEIVFRALADMDDGKTWVVTKRKLNKITRKYEMIDFTMDIYQYANEICTTTRNKQNKISNTVMGILEKEFNVNSNIQIYTIDFSKKEFGKLNPWEIKGVSGLIANKLADKFGKPTIVSWYDEETESYIGSLRGNERVLENFKEWCLNTGLFEFVSGHNNAAGVSFKKESLNSIIKEAEKIEATGICYEVDYIFGDLNSSDIYEVDKYKNLWINGVEEPLFAYEDINISTNMIQWSKNTMRIYYGGVTLIKFRISEEEIQEIKDKGPYITMRFVGTTNINEWAGKKYPQIMIKDFEVIDKKDCIDYGIFG